MLQATTDLLGGQVDMMFEQMYSAVPNIRAGKLRALAVTSAKHSPLFTDLPTMAEAGVPGFEVQNWQGFVAPAGTPPEQFGTFIKSEAAKWGKLVTSASIKPE